jgi:hypothetical protein
MHTDTLAARLRRAATWRPGDRTKARVTKVRCPFCRQWRPPQKFRARGGGCRRCTGNG